MDECGTERGESPRYEGSLRRQFFGIDFEQPQPAVRDVFGLIETIAQLHGSYKDASR